MNYNSYIVINVSNEQLNFEAILLESIVNKGGTTS